MTTLFVLSPGRSAMTLNSVRDSSTHPDARRRAGLSERRAIGEASTDDGDP